MKTKVLKALLILTGISMFLSYIWLRFIRIRLPKDIPFNFSILGFFILLYICFIYIFIIYALIQSLNEEQSSKSIFKQIIKNLVETAFLPLYTVDHFIKNLPFLRKYHKNFMVYLAYKLNYNIIETNNYYYFMAIFPRIILVTALFIDTFWLNKLYFIYKILLIGILIILNKYIIYSFKYLKDSLIKDLKTLTEGIIVTPFIFELHAEHYAQIYQKDKESNPNFDEDDWNWELDEIPPTLYIKDIEIFVAFQMKYSTKIDYHLTTNEKFRNIIIKTKNITQDSYPKYRREALDILKEKMEDILQISYIIEKYEYTHRDTSVLIRIKIFTYYLICWVYILVSSIHTLDLLEFIIMLNSTWTNISNPF